ncbi:MAG: class I SAM-dependent rRNA methyltransferase [Acidobacteria bacterium]|nr:class I SAM-dependent rRNA methyltransferase [Acidobacteriota bacterium]
MDRLHVYLKPGREKSVRNRHPWLFSGAVARTEGPEDAPLAEVFSTDGKALASGFSSPRSRIPVRLVGPPGTVVDQAFFDARLRQARELRSAVVPPRTTGYRLLNAEGDGVPGWVVDRFGDVLVSQITSRGLDSLREEAYRALALAFPESVILQSNGGPARRQEGLPQADEVIRGESQSEAWFAEHGLEFSGELSGGQKTGFYFDQRPNRLRVQELAADRRVLDLFAHSGAFGIYALRGGATSVVAVESAERLLDRGRRHAEANRTRGVDPDRIEWVAADVFEDLRQRQERYGLVVCDPPPLARRQSDRDRAARAYKDLNRLALKRIEDGGFLLTFSCSAAIDGRLFRQILFAAAKEADLHLDLLQPLAAGADHPVSVFHPEGEYLKGWLGRVRRLG